VQFPPDLLIKLDRIFQDRSLESLSDEQVLTALYALQTMPAAHQLPTIRAITINHVRMSRFLEDLDKKNTRLTWAVIILAALAVIVGSVQIWVALSVTH
jgi:hypothetical protein